MSEQEKRAALAEAAQSALGFLEVQRTGFAIQDKLRAALSAPQEEREGKPEFKELGTDGHRVVLEFDGGGSPSLKLLHPESGCEPATQCALCGRVEESESEPCHDCKQGFDPHCWLTDWFDNLSADELLHGKVTVAVDAEWEQDHPKIVINGPVPTQQSEGEGKSSGVEAGVLDAVKNTLLRSREARHLSPPERGSEDWLAWEGDAAEDAADVLAALDQRELGSEAAVDVLRRFMCCKAGEQFVDEKLLRPFGFTLDSGPVVRANRNLIDALEWIEVETRETHTRDAARRAIDSFKALALTQQSVPEHSGEGHWEIKVTDEKLSTYVALTREKAIAHTTERLLEFFKAEGEPCSAEEAADEAAEIVDAAHASPNASQEQDGVCVTYISTQQSVSNQSSEHSGVEKAVEELAELLWSDLDGVGTWAGLSEDQRNRWRTSARRYVAAIQSFPAQPEELTRIALALKNQGIEDCSPEEGVERLITWYVNHDARLDQRDEIVDKLTKVCPDCQGEMGGGGGNSDEPAWSCSTCVLGRVAASPQPENSGRLDKIFNEGSNEWPIATAESQRQWDPHAYEKLTKNSGGVEKARNLLLAGEAIDGPSGNWPLEIWSTLWLVLDPDHLEAFPDIVDGDGELVHLSHKPKTPLEMYVPLQLVEQLLAPTQPQLSDEDRERIEEAFYSLAGFVPAGQGNAKLDLLRSLAERGSHE